MIFCRECGDSIDPDTDRDEARLWREEHDGCLREALGEREARELAGFSRKKRNAEIANAIKNGTYLAPAFDNQASWFPDRGKTQKSLKDIIRIFDQPKPEGDK